MNLQEETQALSEIYKEVPILRPDDTELAEIFAALYAREDEIPNLPHGYDPLKDYSSQT